MINYYRRGVEVDDDAIVMARTQEGEQYGGELERVTLRVQNGYLRYAR